MIGRSEIHASAIVVDRTCVGELRSVTIYTVSGEHLHITEDKELMQHVANSVKNLQCSFEYMFSKWYYFGEEE